jgi:hypothetical protein
MKTPTTEEMIAAASIFDEHIGEIREFAEDFAETYLHSSEVYQALKQAAELADDPQKIESTSLYLVMYILASILSDRYALTKFLQTYRKMLSSEAMRLLNDCRAHAPHWIIARITDTPCEDAYHLQDTITGEDVILYSREFSRFLTEEDEPGKLFITCIMFNGVCYQPIYIIYSYNLLAEDFLWYTRSFQDPEQDTVPLTSLILEQYLDFFTINDISAVPIPETFGEPESVYWAEFPLTALPEIPGKWKRETRPGYEKLSYRGTDEELRAHTAPEVLKGYNLNSKKRSLWVSTGTPQPEITLCHDTGTALFLAHSRFDFYLTRELIKLNNNGEPRDLQPDGSVSEVYYRFTSIHDFCPMPFDSYIAPFLSGKDFLVRMRELFQALMQIEGGDPAEFEELLRRFGDDGDETLRAQKANVVLLASEGLPQTIIDKELDYLLDPHLSLPQWQRERIINYSEVEPLWLVCDRETCVNIFSNLVGHLRKQEDFREDPMQYMEDLFQKPFGDLDGYMIMDMTMIMLHAIGNRWIAVRTYALEILEHFHELLEDTYTDEDAYENDDEDVLELGYELFIERYSRFVYRILCRNGICSLKERPTSEQVTSGTYCVQRTELVTVLFTPAEEDFT